jgi:regulator of sigma D
VEAIMGGKDSLIDFWNFMGFSEKQQLMQQFRKIHGNHYNKEDFAKFLAERSKRLQETSKSVDGKP